MTTAQRLTIAIGILGSMLIVAYIALDVFSLRLLAALGIHDKDAGVNIIFFLITSAALCVSAFCALMIRGRNRTRVSVYIALLIACLVCLIVLYAAWASVGSMSPDLQSHEHRSGLRQHAA